MLVLVLVKVGKGLLGNGLVKIVLDMMEVLLEMMRMLGLVE